MTAAGMAQMYVGARCTRCSGTEQACAERVLDGGCCDGCSHFRHLDEHGNDKRIPPYGKARPTQLHGTEVGWNWHRANGTLPCGDCTFAHRQHKAQRILGRTG